LTYIQIRHQLSLIRRREALPILAARLAGAGQQRVELACVRVTHSWLRLGRDLRKLACGWVVGARIRRLVLGRICRRRLRFRVRLNRPRLCGSGNRRLLVINLLLRVGCILAHVRRRQGVLQLLLLLLLLLVEEVVWLTLGPVVCLLEVPAHHLVLLLADVRNVSVLLTLGGVEICGGGLLQVVDAAAILAANLLRLHLLNYLLHVLTCVLQLRKLFLEADVEGFERYYFLGRRHALDTCQQVVRNIV